MIFAANFKTNHTRASTKSYLDRLEEEIKTNKEDRFYLFPPMTALQKHNGKITIGSQNGYPTQKGSFTGEVGLEQLDEFGIKTILIGHSERRQLLNESNEQIVQKFEFFKQHGFEIIYCIGEPLEVRELGGSQIAKYLIEQLSGIDTNYHNLTIAYEPIWAIGTGKSATQEEIAKTHSTLRHLTTQPLLYGGSVNLENVKEITSIANVDGVLVGSASLDIVNFSKLIKSIQ